jgi:deoxyribonuclease (pyrimidine dimer)
MTRLNLIPVSVLTRRHAMAEYKELTQVLAPLRKTSDKKDRTLLLKKIPQRFTLSTGHVSFFYDKGQYLLDRYQDLKENLCSRGVSISEEDHIRRIDYIRNTFLDASQKICYNLIRNWQPSYEDVKIVLERIDQRIQEKPHLYPDKNIFDDYKKELNES